MYIIENICSLSEPLLINSYFSSDLKNVIVQIQCKFGFIKLIHLPGLGLTFSQCLNN